MNKQLQNLCLTGSALLFSFGAVFAQNPGIQAGAQAIQQASSDLQAYFRTRHNVDLYHRSLWWDYSEVLEFIRNGKMAIRTFKKVRLAGLGPSCFSYQLPPYYKLCFLPKSGLERINQLSLLMNANNSDFRIAVPNAALPGWGRRGHGWLHRRSVHNGSHHQ